MHGPLPHFHWLYHKYNLTRNVFTGGGVDYNSGPYTVTFIAGATTRSFDVPINNENIVESDEEFTLTIDQSSLPAGVTTGVPDTTRVTIVNDDCKWFVYSKPC